MVTMVAQTGKKTEEVKEMNEKGKNIILNVDKEKSLKSFYALGFEAEDVMGILYQAIVVLCKQKGIDPALQLLHLTVAAEEGGTNEIN